MRLRKNILPQIFQDQVVTLFVSLIIPLVYWFEVFIVLPKFYDEWSPTYTFHFILGTFILLNITTNYIGIMVCDTSINGLVLPATLLKNWRFCSTCESIAPPRSWHCNVCKTCVLKRDHHCIFTGCCIGHKNQRYFMMFIFYIFVATIYASYYNIYFIYESVELNSWVSIVKIMFPLAMLFVEISAGQLYLFLVLIVAFGCVFTGILSFFHTHMMVRGVITYEQKYKIAKYNLGLLENVKVALGERWYLTWVSPFLESEVKHDGVYWEETEHVKDK